MAVTLGTLCEKSDYLYGLRVIAGNEGMSNIVQWVHTVEDIEVSDFLHGGELIFSTGIANKGIGWMLPFVKNLVEKQASGLVLNIGPYIREIPLEIINYCNSQNFPLMEIPWKTRIVDISRDFCNQIILKERKEETIGETVKNLIFFPDDYKKHIPVLESNDFDVNTNYCIVGIKADMADGASPQKLEYAFEKLIYSFKTHWGGFRIDNTFFYVFNDLSDKAVSDLAARLQEEENRFSGIEKLYVAVSKKNGRLKHLPKSYQIVLRLLRLAQRRDMSPIFYDDLEIKKLILAVDDTDLLKSIYSENLKRLEQFDRDNGTDYMNFLRLYLKNDGSVQKLAEETFVHRNTINYQMSKIKKILGNDLKTLDDRFKIILAFEIYDVL